MVSLLSAVFLLRCLFSEWVRGMQMLGAVCLKYLNLVLQCFAGLEGETVHTHTHDDGMAAENYRYISPQYKMWYFNLTTNSFIFFHFFVSPDQHLDAWCEWKESATFFCETQECIWLHGKLILFWLLNDNPSSCNECVPGESILHTLIDGGTGWAVGHDLCAFSWSLLLLIHCELFSCSVIDLRQCLTIVTKRASSERNLNGINIQILWLGLQ